MIMSKAPLKTQPVEIGVGDIVLHADLRIPAKAKGIVLFAHGSGSSRHSPRNCFVAEILNDAGLATLLLDLLTVEEELTDRVTAELRFDIDLLASRLIDATDWLASMPSLKQLSVAYFGASTGAAAALMAAAERPQKIVAVVSRGGRPDLAGNALERVKAPTLLIVGGNDPVVLDLNEQAQEHLNAPNDLIVVAGASHLFEEPGTLQEVAELARDWFKRYV